MGVFEDMGDILVDNMDDAVETITYVSKAGSAVEVSSSFAAHVFRSEPDSDSRFPRGSRAQEPSIQVYVSASDIADVNIGQDTITIKRHLGDSGTVQYRVRSVASQGPDGFMLNLGT